MSTIHSLVIKNTEIPSNVFFAPFNCGYSLNGRIQKGYSDFYVNHAGNEIGICYVGNVSVNNNGRTNKGTATLLCTPDNEWESLTNRIRLAGSLPGIQLAFAPSQFTMQKTFYACNIAETIGSYRTFYAVFNDGDTVEKEFISAAQKSYSLGFDVIQIHAAHGYLLSLLLSRSISKCIDPRETKGFTIVSNIIKNLKAMGGLIDIRLSLYEGIDDGPDEFAYKSRLFDLLIECGVDIISLSNGFYNINKKMIYPSKDNTMHILEDAICLAQNKSQILWNVAGNMEYALINQIQVPDNFSFSLGRQLLSDPQAVLKMKSGLYDQIIPCSECNRCHYYSYDLDGIQECNL